jgi:hypothetical protein
MSYAYFLCELVLVYFSKSVLVTLEFEPDELGGEGLGAEPKGKYKDEG